MVTSEKRDREVLTGEHSDHEVAANRDNNSSCPCSSSLNQGTVGCLLFLSRFIWEMRNLKPKEFHYIPGQSHYWAVGIPRWVCLVQDLCPSHGVLHKYFRRSRWRSMGQPVRREETSIAFLCKHSTLFFSFLQLVLWIFDYTEKIIDSSHMAI